MRRAARRCGVGPVAGISGCHGPHRAGRAADPGGSSVRNGLDETVVARASARVPQLGLAELLLQSPLPDARLRVAARDPFPGSVAMAMEFAPQRAGLPGRR